MVGRVWGLGFEVSVAWGRVLQLTKSRHRRCTYFRGLTPTDHECAEPERYHLYQCRNLV